MLGRSIDFMYRHMGRGFLGNCELSLRSLESKAPWRLPRKNNSEYTICISDEISTAPTMLTATGLGRTFFAMSHIAQPHNQIEALIVRFFVDMGHSATSIRAAFERYLAEGCVWQNQGLPTVEGKQEILRFLDHFLEGVGLQDVGGEVRAVASEGPFVLTERHERWIGRDGAVLVESFPLMGIFRVDNGLITEWRDYYDSALLAHLT